MQRARKAPSPFTGTNGNIRAVNTGRTTIHSALGIKPGANLSGISSNTEVFLRNIITVKLLMMGYPWSLVISRLK